VLPGYKNFLNSQRHEELLKNRTALTIEQYEEFYNFRLPHDGSDFETPTFKTGPFRLKAIHNHKRLYEAPF
jgi:hydroxymethylglutaryl-CoA synthase